MKIIGRDREKKLLKACLDARQPEFIALYGRRRVGKTYLIREFFNDNFAFSLTGASKKGMSIQLAYFDAAMRKYEGKAQASTKSWQEGFEKLIGLLTKTKSRISGKRVVFIDELAWLDTPRSGFLSALEHFWNAWGSAQPDLILIVCASSSSWIIKKILKNRGGLHNRVTRRILLEPFSLAEADEFFLDRNIDYNKKSVADAYMIFGGIPFYLNMFTRGTSALQNVDDICFAFNAPLQDEFEEVYASLFKNANRHMRIVKALASKKKGLDRDEIAVMTGLSSGGGLTDLLAELEQSGFIRKYNDFSGKDGRYLYQLIDFFTLFYLTYMKDKKHGDENYWSNIHGKPAFNTWSGHSFEMLCLTHAAQIKAGLGISGISASFFSWRSAEASGCAQIDLVIDRSDGIIDLCEMKYYKEPYAISKSEAEKLEARKKAFITETHTKKNIHLIMMTSEGLKQNAHSHVIQADLTLSDLFV